MLPDVELEAGGTAVVVGANTELAVPAGEMLIVLDSARIGTGLRNAGDRVALIDPFGARRDAVSWGDVRIPFFVSVPAAGQSIARNKSGGVRLADRLTPWAVEERVAPPDPDTPPMHGSLAIIEAVWPEGSIHEPARMVIRNVSDQPLLTINWRLSVGARAVTLPSVRLEAGERRAFTAERLGIDGWLNAGAGRLILRDAHGRWLSTASWGADTTFHEIEARRAGEPIWFTDARRVRPEVPWHRWFERQDVLVVSDVSRQRVAAALRRRTNWNWGGRLPLREDRHMGLRLSRRSLLKAAARLGAGAALAALGIGRGEPSEAQEEAEEPYFQESATKLTLGNRYYEVDFDKQNGAITRIFDKRGGGTVSEGNAGGSLWSLLWEEYGTRHDWHWRHAAEYTSKRSWDRDTNRLTFEYRLRDSEIEASLRITATISDAPWLTLEAHLEHSRGPRVDFLSFPHDLTFRVASIKQALEPIVARRHVATLLLRA